MEPRYLLMLIHYIYYRVVLLESSARIKVPKDRGMAYSCSSYLVTEVTRPCVGRDPVRFLGRPARGDPMWQ